MGQDYTFVPVTGQLTEVMVETKHKKKNKRNTLYQSEFNKVEVELWRNSRELCD